MGCLYFFGIPDHKYVCCLSMIKCMHIFALLFKFQIIKLLLCPSNCTKICTLWHTQRVSNYFHVTVIGHLRTKSKRTHDCNPLSHNHSLTQIYLHVSLLFFCDVLLPKICFQQYAYNKKNVVTSSSYMYSVIHKSRKMNSNSRSRL